MTFTIKGGDMKLILAGNKNTHVEGEKIIFLHNDPLCKKIHPKTCKGALCFIRLSSKGKISDDVTFSKKEAAEIRRFLNKAIGNEKQKEFKKDFALKRAFALDVRKALSATLRGGRFGSLALTDFLLERWDISPKSK